MNKTTTVTTGQDMPKKIAILDYTDNTVTIRSFPQHYRDETLGIDDDSVRQWLRDNGYSYDVDYMVGDFDLIIDN